MSVSRGSYTALFLFLVLVVAVGFTIGLIIRPGEWYQSLTKPWFTPPNWLFAPAWTLVYILIAIAGWRVTTVEGFNSIAFRLWMAQMLSNWTWTPVFFGFHQIELGLAVIVCLLAIVVAFMIKVQDRFARWCFAPYALWLVYATSLNAAIFLLN
ncbi:MULTISPECIES: TspO/MBR family protein [Rhizobium/Agrobacterium group]|uniref:Tryptophan-rich sensory protein n=1 Tax=Neorhizobium huautlense TaxID=67774 RepID=A0ABT9PWW7_9HYPH|nr:TspO/MBR family protein [Neorhizobium huautlense]MDP9838715.1 tryptophan-rich sensory protein [Neorhizobium huautlense]